MSLAKLCGKRSKSIPLEIEDLEKRSDCRIEEVAEKLKLLRQEELGRSARIHIQHILHCPKDTYLFHMFRS